VIVRGALRADPGPPLAVLDGVRFERPHEGVHAAHPDAEEEERDDGQDGRARRGERENVFAEKIAMLESSSGSENQRMIAAASIATTFV
jgi:hypothetical protein